MLSIRSSADMARALSGPLDPQLRRLLTFRRDQLLEYEGYDLAELAHIVVAEPGDTLAAINAEAGLGERPLFESVERHTGWTEAVMILTDDGFGLVLLVPDDGDPALLRLLLTHA